ncbi:hypothetical protein HPP92_022053 [Vanilla planifolia]|uniref:Uncharacterized protein n=1 Tax=Vanilla planifolia TaxID=51239 RepID=A0A835PUM1_VANPL|nr:hypothetical protein HPP92_022384 [Vanilla planifolia]KAG0458925.1 hypothetical protein HPP92_022053 [Vanilla planifolia]
MAEAASGCRLIDIRLREVGALAPRSFFRRAAASLDLFLRLGIQKKLEKHRGCVNTVGFNADGNILISGSDDRMVMLWDWEFGTVKTSFHSGHTNNIFHARFMPYTDDMTIVTCAADGEVRLAQLLDDGHVARRTLAKHDKRVHKFAIEPGSPNLLYSCGEDGLVQQIDLRTQTATKLFKCKAIKDESNYVPILRLHAIAIDPRNPNHFSIAGSDEYARLYDVRKCNWDGKTCSNPIDCFCPPHLIGDEIVGITGLAFSDQSELLVSYNSDLIYLFSKDQGLGSNPLLEAPMPSSMDIDSREKKKNENSVYSSSEDSNSYCVLQAFGGHHNFNTVKGVSFLGPSCEYVASGSDSGHVFIWSKRNGKLLRVMEADKKVVNCVEPHPWLTMIATSGIENDIKIWMPIAEESVAPVDVNQIMMHNEVDWFDNDDFDSDDDFEDEDDSMDDNDINYSSDID